MQSLLQPFKIGARSIESVLSHMRNLQEELEDLEAEQMLHGDLLVGDNNEAYDNLALKTLSSLEFFLHFCHNVSRTNYIATLIFTNKNINLT